MPYRPKKYVYIAILGYYSQDIIGVYATKGEAMRAAHEQAKDTGLTTWVERHDILKFADDEKQVKRYDE